MDELIIWVPSNGQMIYMQSGCGNLTTEDYLNGYNAYIDYTVSTLQECNNNEFKEDDGGMYLYAADDNDITLHINELINFINDTEIENSYVILSLESNFAQSITNDNRGLLNDNILEI